MNEALQAELDAIRPAPNRPFVEPFDWLSTAESIIRQTITECQGRDPRILNLTLLCRYPFTPDQTEAKTIWYAELQRQIVSSDLTESYETEIPHSSKAIIPRQEWADTARTIIRESLELYSPYSRQKPGQWSDDTKKLEAFFLELKRRLPFEMDPDEIPVDRNVSTPEQTDMVTYHREFQAVWYQECARELGFHEPGPRVSQPPAVSVPAKRSEKQKTLF